MRGWRRTSAISGHPWYETLAATLEYALLSEHCGVIEQVWLIVASLDPGGYILTAGFEDAF